MSTCCWTAPLRKAVRLVLDPAPEGLTRALERLGEIAWTPEDYRVLVALLADPKPAKTLRHAAQIDPLQVRTLGALPRPLRDAGGVAVRVSAAQAKLLAEAHALLSRRLPEGSWPSGSRPGPARRPPRTLFNLVADDFRRELPKPPHPGTERLRPLETRGGDPRRRAALSQLPGQAMSTMRSTAAARSMNGCRPRAR
jgi:hypothetical protein